MFACEQCGSGRISDRDWAAAVMLIGAVDRRFRARRVRRGVLLRAVGKTSVQAPRSAAARVASLLTHRVDAAMFAAPARRNRLMARFRSVAIARGREPGAR